MLSLRPFPLTPSPPKNPEDDGLPCALLISSPHLSCTLKFTTGFSKSKVGNLWKRRGTGASETSSKGTQTETGQPLPSPGSLQNSCRRGWTRVSQSSTPTIQTPSWVPPVPVQDRVSWPQAWSPSQHLWGGRRAPWRAAPGEGRAASSIHPHHSPRSRAFLDPHLSPEDPTFVDVTGLAELCQRT